MANPVPKTSPLPEGPPPCFVCKQPGSLACTGCKNARYCSSECQNKDWKAAGSHKFVCKAFTLIGPRPSKSHFRGIFFPPDEKELRFVWMEYEDPSNYCTLKVEPFMGEKMSTTLSLETVAMYEETYKLDYNIHLWCKDLFVHLPVNPSIDRMWQRLGHFNGRWRGPFLASACGVASACEKEAEDDEDYEGERIYKPLDLDTSDLASIIKILAVYP